MPAQVGPQLSGRRRDPAFGGSPRRAPAFLLAKADAYADPRSFRLGVAYAIILERRRLVHGAPLFFKTMGGLNNR